MLVTRERRKTNDRMHIKFKQKKNLKHIIPASLDLYIDTIFPYQSVVRDGNIEQSLFFTVNFFFHQNEKSMNQNTNVLMLF